MLPVYDGITVLRRIRKVSDIPIIMLTARNQASEKIRIIKNLESDRIDPIFCLRVCHT